MIRRCGVWIHKIFKMINQDFKASGTNYHVLPKLGSVAGSYTGGSKLPVRMLAQILHCLGLL